MRPARSTSLWYGMFRSVSLPSWVIARPQQGVPGQQQIEQPGQQRQTADGVRGRGDLAGQRVECAAAHQPTHLLGDIAAVGPLAVEQ